MTLEADCTSIMPHSLMTELKPQTPSQCSCPPADMIQLITMLQSSCRTTFASTGSISIPVRRPLVILQACVNATSQICSNLHTNTITSATCCRQIFALVLSDHSEFNALPVGGRLGTGMVCPHPCLTAGSLCTSCTLQTHTCCTFYFCVSSSSSKHCHDWSASNI